MNRRNFIRGAATVTAVAAGWMLDNPLLPSFRVARAADGKTLVVVFQRGGCDGLNTCVPHGDDNYYALRPTIAIPPPDSGESHRAIDLDGFFGLHPSLAPLQPLYDDGDLAVMPAVHYPDASRSHFNSQRFIESADRAEDRDGWLNRYLQTRPSSALLRAMGVGNALPDSLRGSTIVSTFDDLRRFNFGVNAEQEEEMMDRLSRIYAQAPDPDRRYSQSLHDFGVVALSDVGVIGGLNVNDYTPANGAVYPNSTFGRQMMHTALLIKAGVGLELAALSIGGWDTHSDQGNGAPDGAQARQLGGFAAAIAAFHQDLGTAMNDVVVLTMTEFGRTAAENGSFGTDHGHASTWFALGKGSVNGGIHLGDRIWPGLGEADMVNGRYLDHTMDYRDIYGELLSNHLGVSSGLSSLLAGHNFSPLGILPG